MEMDEIQPEPKQSHKLLIQDEVETEDKKDNSRKDIEAQAPPGLPTVPSTNQPSRGSRPGAIAAMFWATGDHWTADEVRELRKARATAFLDLLIMVGGGATYYLESTGENRVSMYTVASGIEVFGFGKFVMDWYHIWSIYWKHYQGLQEAVNESSNSQVDDLVEAERFKLLRADVLKVKNIAENIQQQKELLENPEMQEKIAKEIVKLVAEKMQQKDK
jgi:hypothetical protein